MRVSQYARCIKHPGKLWCRQMNMWRLMELTRSPMYRVRWARHLLKCAHGQVLGSKKPRQPV